eukprot:TRINITY_DN4402_c0_g1_i2.p1 TRINITY_DN4402_c0_g1~~TRINITY_DN4402_c0_g1_i2.p1  ORF type:complete len:388 (+),score=115.38 TRINITY_DN4402_c0_g1_i2:104-1165(+)
MSDENEILAAISPRSLQEYKAEVAPMVQIVEDHLKRQKESAEAAMRALRDEVYAEREVSEALRKECKALKFRCRDMARKARQQAAPVPPPAAALPAAALAPAAAPPPAGLLPPAAAAPQLPQSIAAEPPAAGRLSGDLDSDSDEEIVLTRSEAAKLWARDHPPSPLACRGTHEYLKKQVAALTQQLDRERQERAAEAAALRAAAQHFKLAAEEAAARPAPHYQMMDDYDCEQLHESHWWHIKEMVADHPPGCRCYQRFIRASQAAGSDKDAAAAAPPPTAATAPPPATATAPPPAAATAPPPAAQAAAAPAKESEVRQREKEEVQERAGPAAGRGEGGPACGARGRTNLASFD